MGLVCNRQWALYRMGLVWNGPYTQWAWCAMGLIHNGLGVQWTLYTQWALCAMGRIHSGLGVRWALYAMGLVDTEMTQHKEDGVLQVL